MQAASEQEREYVARYGQKAYQMGSGNQIANMPQPLTPGHTSTLRIKALPEQELTAPGKGLFVTQYVRSLGGTHSDACFACSCYGTCHVHSFESARQPLQPCWVSCLYKALILLLCLQDVAGPWGACYLSLGILSARPSLQTVREIMLSPAGECSLMCVCLKAANLLAGMSPTICQGCHQSDVVQSHVTLRNFASQLHPCRKDHP